MPAHLRPPAITALVVLTPRERRRGSAGGADAVSRAVHAVEEMIRRSGDAGSGDGGGGRETPDPIGGLTENDLRSPLRRVSDAELPPPSAGRSCSRR